MFGRVFEQALRSYASMVNDMLGMRDNKVSLAHLADLSEDMKQAVLGHQDDFFRQHMCATNRPALQNSNTVSMYNDWGTVARDVFASDSHTKTLFVYLKQFSPNVAAR